MQPLGSATRGVGPVRLRWVAAIGVLALATSACGARFEGHEETTVAAGHGTPATSASTAPADTTADSGATETTAAGPVEPGRTTGITADTIKIGYLLPLSGAAPVPSRFDVGVNVYWNVVNQQGGIDGRKVTVVIEDTQSQAEVGKDKAKKLIEDDKVFAIVVLDRLENQEAIGEYLNSRKVPNIEIQTPANLPQDQTWSFGVTIDHEVQGKLVAEYFVNSLKAKNAALIYENTPTLDPGVSAFKAEMKKLGGKVSYSKTVEGQQNDFANEALALKDSGAKAVWLYMAPTPAASLANQAHSAGYDPVWFANSISWNFDLILKVAPDALNNARAFSPWLPLDDPRADPYKQAYREQNPGQTPDDLGIVGWGVGQIVAEGLKQAGPELGQNSFRNAMQNLKFAPDIWAPLDFSPGVREGANVVAVLKQDGDHWALEHDFTDKF